MATPKKTAEEVTAAPVVDDPKANWVEVYIPKQGQNDDPMFPVGLNDKLWTIPKGIPTKVPPEVKAAIDRAQQAQMRMDMRIDKLTAQAAQQP